MSAKQCMLVTGATGKVGQTFIRRLFSDTKFSNFKVRALCHNRTLDPSERLEVVKGSIQDRKVVAEALRGVSHVLHLATCKETPEDIMDVAIKGMFWLLEECRQGESFRQFILVGGDAAVGHSVLPRALPVTEEMPHMAYPGCYALSKVLEEVMLEQYYIQYDLAGCCLRAPWIMEKDDFKYQLSFGEDVFGGPRWRDLVGAKKADEYTKAGMVPLMQDRQGRPVLRNFVHVEDLVTAILIAIDNKAAHQQTFNICMNEPVDYGKLAAYLKRTRGIDSVPIETDFHRNWLDNAKARLMLGWHPEYDLEKMADSAFDYQRAENDPRKVWYPG